MRVRMSGADAEMPSIAVGERLHRQGVSKDAAEEVVTSSSQFRFRECASDLKHGD
jgi:hypothetical protein